MAMSTFRASYTRRRIFFSSYCVPPGDPEDRRLSRAVHLIGSWMSGCDGCRLAGCIQLPKPVCAQVKDASKLTAVRTHLI